MTIDDRKDAFWELAKRVGDPPTSILAAGPVSTIDNEPPPLSNIERRRIARVLLTHAVDCDRLGHSAFAMLLEDTARSILTWPIDARDAQTAANIALNRHMYHEDIAWPWAIVAVELGGI